MIIGIDMGKYATKSVSQNGKKQFLTRVALTEETRPTDGGYVLEFQGKKYMINDNIEKYSFDTSKQTIEHKIAMYLAISQHINVVDEIELAVGMPITLWHDKQTRDEYKEYLSQDRIVDIVVNGQAKTFTIKNITIVPETVGGIYAHIGRFDEDLIGVLDIGNLNINGCIYDKRRPYKNSAFCTNDGASILKNEISKALNSKYSKYNVNVQDFEVPHIINKGFYLNMDGTFTRVNEADKIIEDIMFEHIDKIINDMKKRQWNTASLNIVCIGGGSKLLRKHLTVKLPQTNSENNWIEQPEFANALGFYNLARALYKNRG